MVLAQQSTCLPKRRIHIIPCRRLAAATSHAWNTMVPQLSQAPIAIQEEEKPLHGYSATVTGKQVEDRIVKDCLANGRVQYAAQTPAKGALHQLHMLPVPFRMWRCVDNPHSLNELPQRKL